MNWLRKLFRREEKSPYVHLTIDDLRTKKVIISYGNKAVFIGMLTNWELSQNQRGDMQCHLELLDWHSIERIYRVES